jgi:hypothetical protein
MNYPKYITWRKEITELTSVYDTFGKKTQARIKKAFSILESQDKYTLRTVEVDDNFLKEFVPIYRSNMDQKRNTLHIDIASKINERKALGDTYKSVALFEYDKLIGGLIFNDKKNVVKNAYKTTPRVLDIKLPINITFLIEFLFTQYAIDTKKRIMGGQDRNIFGMNAEIGLAMFKVQAGYYPVIINIDSNEILDDFTWNKKDDVLIFEGKEMGGKCDNATLFLATKEEDIINNKYSILLNNKHFKTQTIF